MSLKTLILGDNNYGFITSKQLSNISSIKTIVSNDMKFVCTSDFEDCANNHCAATLLTNLCIFYKAKGYKNFINDDKELFKDVHNKVHDGPILFLANKAKKYFNKYNYNLEINKLKDIEEIKESINLGIPCAMLLMDGLFNWHWVLVIGYKDNYLQILDNWHKDTNRYYLINNGSKLINVSSYKLV